MNKLFVLFAFCLINVSLAARLPRSAETKDSSSSEEVDFPALFKLLVNNIAASKNITLSEAQKESAVAVVNKDNQLDLDEATLKDVEKLKVELSAVIPSAVAEEITNLFSKFTKEATSDEAVEGFITLTVHVIDEALKQLADALDDSAENKV